MSSRRCPTCSSTISRSGDTCPVCGATTALRRRLIPRITTPIPALAPATAGLHFAATSGSSSALPVPASDTPEPTEAETPSGPGKGWTFRRIAFWVFMAILATFSIVAGIMTWRVISTMDTINSKSTPPAVLSGAALGGSPEVQIDSGPARTAVANANATKTAVAANRDNPQPTTVATDAPVEPTSSSTAAPTSSPEPTVASEPPTVPSSHGNVADMPPPPNLAETNTPEPEPTATVLVEATAPPATETVPALEPTQENTAQPTSTTANDVQSPTTIIPDTETPVEPGETPVDTATAASTDTATVVPTDTATPEPTATSTPPADLSEIERIQNNSFEEGTDPWYIEPGVSVAQSGDAIDGQSVLEVAPTGGFFDQRVFFVPGTEYYLTVSARMSVADESAEFGIIYLDAEEQRLRDREPAPIMITGNQFSTFSMTFTVPDDIAYMKVYGYKDTGTGTLQIDTTSLRSIVPPYIEGGSTDDPVELSDGAMTILFMGVDAREGEAIDGEVRPDSLMIVHLNPESNSCRILSIPRDSRVELPGYGYSKINHALAVGGIEYEIEVVTQFTGVPIDHYVLIDFNGFQDLVDAIGGVTIDVPQDFTAIDTTEFHAGEQQMTGKQALSYARHRGDNEGDFGRIERQQQVIRALIREANGLDIVTSINELLPAVGNNLRTDLSIAQIADIATTYKSICTEEAISMVHLEGQIATYDDPLLQMPLSYVVIDEAEVRRKVADLLAP